MGLRMGCAGMLMRAHPDMLKIRLGITDAQLAKIQAVRNNVISKRISSRAQLAQIRLKLRTLGEQDLPDEKKVLNLMRTARGVRGRMTEEGVKAHLKILRMLKKAQRAMLRATCAQRTGWGQRGNRRWGKGGRGFGRRGGGRGFGGRGLGGPGGPGGPGGW